MTRYYVITFVALLALVIALPLYGAREPARMAAAQRAFNAEMLDYAAGLYVEQCALCHGAAGEGVEGVGKALACDCRYEGQYDVVFRAIADGVPNTTMAGWHLSRGGMYGDIQIEALVTLIQTGNWSAVQALADARGFVPLLELASAYNDLAPTDEIGNWTLVKPLYDQVCAVCHGLEAEGVAGQGNALTDNAVRNKGAHELQRLIQEGVPGTTMIGYGVVLDDSAARALTGLLLNWEQVDRQ